MRGSRAAGASLAALLLAGCFGMCGFSPSGANWTDPALFAAMPAPGPVPGGVSTWHDPEPGLPFTTIIDPAWGPTNLTAVERQSDGGRYEAVRVWLTPAGLAASRVNATAESALAAAAEAFVANTTTLSASARQALVDHLLTTGHEEDQGFTVYGEDMVPLHYVAYSVPVPEGLRLDALYADLAAVGALQVGLGGAQAGPWSFSFSLTKRELQAEGARLDVGPTGVATFEGLADGERPRKDYEDDVRAWLGRQGLAAPATMDIGGSIC